MILHIRKFRIIPNQGDPRTISKKKKVALGETISKIVHKKKIYIYIYILAFEQDKLLL